MLLASEPVCHPLATQSYHSSYSIASCRSDRYLSYLANFQLDKMEDSSSAADAVNLAYVMSALLQRREFGILRQDAVTILSCSGDHLHKI